MTTFERVCKIISGVAHVPVAQITPRSKLGDFALDSLGFVEFVMSLEDDLELQIPTESMSQFTEAWQDITVQEIVAWIESQKE